MFYIKGTHFDYQHPEIFQIPSKDTSSDALFIPHWIPQLLSSSTTDQIYALMSYRSILSPCSLTKLLILYWRYIIGNEDLDYDSVERIFKFCELWMTKCPARDFSSPTLQFLWHRWLTQAEQDLLSLQVEPFFYYKQRQRIDLLLGQLCQRSNETTSSPASSIQTCSTKGNKRFSFLTYLSKEGRLSMHLDHSLFLTWVPEEKLALHFTLLQEQKLLACHWYEFINISSPSVQQLIARFNLLTEWTLWSILALETPRERGYLIKYFYQLSLQFLKQNNYDHLIAILLALQHSSITRLLQSWAYTSPQIRQEFHETTTEKFKLRKYSSPTKNWKYLRDAVAEFTNDLPGMGYFGIYVSDLVLNQEAKNDFIQSQEVNTAGLEKKLNLNKMYQKSKIVLQFMKDCQGLDLDQNRLRPSYKDYYQLKQPIEEYLLDTLNQLDQLVQQLKSKVKQDLNIKDSELEPWLVSKLREKH